MKKYIKNIIMLSIMMSFIFLSYISNASTLIMKLVFDDKVINYEAEEVKLMVDNNEVVTKEMPPIILDDRTLVPAREMFEQMGATVLWNQETKQVFITQSNSQVILKINSDDAYVTIESNTTKYKLDVVAMIINNKTMIPLRFVSEALNFKVDWNNETRTVLIDTNKELTSNEQEDKNLNENKEEIIIKDDTRTVEGLFINESVDIKKANFEWNNKQRVTDKEVQKYTNDKENIKIVKEKNSMCNIIDILHEESDDEANVTIKADGRITDVKVSEWEGKLVLDIDNSLSEVQANFIPKNNIFLSAIRTSQYTKTSTRIVLDLLDSKNYFVSLSNDRKEIKINIYKNEIYKIKLIEKEDISTFEIYALGKISYDSFRMTEDDRIVLDILGSESKLGTKTADIKNSKNIRKIRTSLYEKNTTRFVFDTIGQKTYEIIQDEKENKIIINIKNPGYKNITYLNNKNYNIELKLDKSSSIDIDDIDIVEDYKNLDYQIKLPKKLSIGQGELLSEDARVEKIIICVEDNKHVIKLKANSEIAIEVSKSGNNLEFDIVRPGEKYDKVLVIDPGHGGTDPGANVGKYMEKNYNLKLGLQIKEYLEEKTDIKVYMTRDDDSYPSLKERAELANTIKADMYISMHNNAMDAKKWNGTEVLYNDSVIFQNNKKNVNNLTNKLLAETLSKGIINGLNSKYKNNNSESRNGTNIKDGISLRTDLAVLKLAKMPASLIELAFMTNDDDLANLNNPDFIEKASEVIAKIIEDTFDDFDL